MPTGNINPTVARHIFQALPVWIYTQSNITQASLNIIYPLPALDSPTFISLSLIYNSMSYKGGIDIGMRLHWTSFFFPDGFVVLFLNMILLKCCFV
jgi:hypothetical protein